MARRLGLIVVMTALIVFVAAASAFAAPHPGAGADCAVCHAAESIGWWSPADLHSATPVQVLLNSDHNTAEPLTDSCLKCHSMFQYPNGVASMVSPINQVGPWTLLTGAWAWRATGCEVCHDPSSVVPGSDPGLAKYGAWLDGDFSAAYISLDSGMATAYANVFDSHTSTYSPTPYSLQATMSVHATKLCDSCHDPEDQGGDSNVMKGSIDYGPQGGDARSFVTSHHAAFGCTECHKTHDFTPIDDPRTDASCNSAGCHVAGGQPILGGVTAPGVVHTNHVVAAAATGLSLRASATSLLRYRYVSLASVLSGGVPAGTTVRYEVKKPGSRSYSLVRTSSVAQTGTSTLRYRLMTRGTYYFRVHFLGNARFRASTSTARKVVSR
jgi:hypothetical protein